MHKTDYEKIAKVLSEARARRDLSRVTSLLFVTDELAKVFEDDNPLFSRHEFVTACMPEAGQWQ